MKTSHRRIGHVTDDIVLPAYPAGCISYPDPAFAALLMTVQWETVIGGAGCLSRLAVSRERDDANT